MSKTMLALFVIPVLLVTLVNVGLNSPTVTKMMVYRSFSTHKVGVTCFKYMDTGEVHGFGNLPNAVHEQGKRIDESFCDNTMQIHDADRFFVQLARGSIGLGEAYHNAVWSIDGDKYDLGDFMSHLSWNVGLQDNVGRKFIKYLSIWDWQQYFERIGMTKTQAEEHDRVSQTYFSTSFFESLLDESLQYTCAAFTNESDDLNYVQVNKARILMREMRIDEEGMNILDIGSGWGYLVNSIHEIYNANVTGITISKAQFNYTTKTFTKPGVSFELIDFRELPSKFGEEFFDRIVSIGMVAHIHIRNLDSWVDSIYRVLKPGGFFVAQGVVNSNSLTNGERPAVRKETACKDYNYPSKYIFPGGCLLLPDWIHDAAMRRGFVTISREYIGQHYARTLRKWRKNMIANKDKVVEEFGVKTFLIHEIYLAHCESSYRTGKVEDTRFIFYKPVRKDFHARPFEEYEYEIQSPYQRTNKFLDHLEDEWVVSQYGEGKKKYD